MLRPARLSQHSYASGARSPPPNDCCVQQQARDKASTCFTSIAPFMALSCCRVAIACGLLPVPLVITTAQKHAAAAMIINVAGSHCGGRERKTVPTSQKPSTGPRGLRGAACVPVAHLEAGRSHCVLKSHLSYRQQRTSTPHSATKSQVLPWRSARCERIGKADGERLPRGGLEAALQNSPP